MAFQLETRRLSMRWLTLADADLMLAIWNDPAFVQHVGDRGIRTIDQANETLSDGAFKLYEDYGYGPYRVALASDDTEIGTCGLFRREGFEDPDIGYSILPAYCGHGFAYEAANAVLAYARSELKLPRITAFISPGNAPSIGLAEKLGLRFERTARLAGEDSDVSLYSMEMQH
ncbi:MAG: GNAT family N-acetyltransferase [Woeseiaceae bacterium]